MTVYDPFEELALFYDPIMEHVDYARWFDITTLLAEKLLPQKVRSLDAACGTGTLLHMFKELQWESYGFDLSPAMLKTAKRLYPEVPLYQGDLRALPFHETFDCITCLFDSVNFILDEDGVLATIDSFYSALKPGGMLYFDIVTERMVTRHFAGQDWTEQNDGFSTRWTSSFDRSSAIAATTVRVNSMKAAIIKERIFPTRLFEDGLQQAGFTTFAVVDVNNWRQPGRRTTRIDFVAIKQPTSRQHNAYAHLEPVLIDYHRHH